MSRRPRKHARAVAVAMLAAGIGGCIFATGADSLALRFETVPAPSVVVGDTLRNASGVAVRLRAYSSDLGRPATIMPLDTSIRVDSLGYLTARSRDTTASAANEARVIAEAGSLQTPPQKVVIVVRPDAVVAHGSAPATILYDPTATGVEADTLNRSDPVQVRVRHFFVPGEAGAAPRDTIVRSFLVRYEVAEFTPGVVERVTFATDTRAESSLDTTDAAGVASRRVRIFPSATATASDSVIVRVRVMYRNADVAGSPVRVAISVRRRS